MKAAYREEAIRAVAEVARGRTAPTLHTVLGLSQNAVNGRLQALMDEVGVPNRAALVNWLYAHNRMGWLKPEPLDCTPLTERQHQVLCLVAQGLTDEQIAAEIDVSPGTVRGHIRNILNRLNASTRAHATAIGWQQNLLGNSQSKPVTDELTMC